MNNSTILEQKYLIILTVKCFLRIKKSLKDIVEFWGYTPGYIIKILNHRFSSRTKVSDYVSPYRDICLYNNCMLVYVDGNFCEHAMLDPNSLHAYSRRAEKAVTSTNLYKPYICWWQPRQIVDIEILQCFPCYTA